MTLWGYLGIAVLMFSVGLYGLLQRRSLVAMLIAIELMLAGISINLITLTRLQTRSAAVGQVIVLILVGVAAAETAIALSLFVAIHRSAHNIDVEQLKELKR